MPKQKTKKAARKRFSVSAQGKIQHRSTRQSHFNAKATGNETRRKHVDKSVAASDLGRIEQLLPYI
jgi:ribosomal protein L35